MGNYEQLKQAVSDVIKTNGNQEQFASDAETIFAWALDNGYRFDFPMNVLLK